MSLLFTAPAPPSPLAKKSVFFPAHAPGPLSSSATTYPTSLRYPSYSSSSASLPRFSRTFSSIRASSSTSSSNNPSEPSNPPPTSGDHPTAVPDEWGEKIPGEPEPEPVSAYTKFSDPDPPRNEDEWGGEESGSVNGPAQVKFGSGGGNSAEKNLELKRCLADSVYGTYFGFRASPEVRAEVSELVNQLEAVNPTPNPTEVPSLLDGNWVLLYTAFSELLPLLAVGTTPLLKVEKITQRIDSMSSTIENSSTLSSPFASICFTASATFEVRSPSRIQVQFKEGIFNPPEIKSRIDLPDNLNVFGQTINLSPVEQTLGPVQEAVAGISRALSGQPPVKVPIPGERTSSWLLTTYLDEDLRIARGDGGLFVLAREGSALLEQ